MKKGISFSTIAAAFLVALTALNCAKTGSPPGGPVDNTPPAILLTEPEDGATGISPPHRIAIHFSEKMNKRSVEQGIRLSPEADWVRFSWEKNLIFVDTLEREAITLVIDSDLNSAEVPAEPVTVGVSGYSQDRRGNAFEHPLAFTFTAGDSLPVGEVTGKATGAKADRKAPPVTVRALSAAESGSGEESGPTVLRIGEAGRQGEFHLAHLPTGEDDAFVLRAHRDDNENGLIDWDFEYYGYSDTLRLTGAAPRIDSVEIVMIYADTPASLEGRITSDHPFDSTVVYLESVEDTTFLATATPDSAGDYSFPNLSAGEYEIRLLTGSPGRIEAEGPSEGDREIIRKNVTLKPGERVERYDLPKERIAPEPAPAPTNPEEPEEPQVTP